ncbi:MAG: phosphatidylglycerol lysyltransferase domain-containing protein [Lachnospiraceae bacterium]|nr:phosphatidylglycerol lysyltransferase domain-containing protein [Lachnospiraceae bacterium]
MALTFRIPVLEDRDIIDQHYRVGDSRSCEDTFANLYLWKHLYPTEFAIEHNMLLLKSAEEDFYFRFPKGNRKKLKEAIQEMMDYSSDHGVDFKMVVVTPEQFELLEQMYPGKFEIEYDRDNADYVYEREKLANLSGKKYHGKKNHINKFMKTYPDWRYETITDENVEECFQMALKWRNQNGCDEEEEKRTEMCVALNSLRLMKELSLRGGCLKVNDEVVAFTIGEPVNHDTFVVHIEKAFTEVDGAYTMINHQFVQHEMEDFLYVNREDDTGAEGLRQAKLSYRPVFMVEKGVVRIKDR